MDASYVASPQQPETAAALFSRLFTEHPHDLGEGYWEHQRRAFTFEAALILAGGACLLHAIVPALCTRTASNAVVRLHKQLLLSGRLSPTS